jgi:hypothetical protein
MVKVQLRRDHAKTRREMTAKCVKGEKVREDAVAANHLFLRENPTCRDMRSRRRLEMS